jgi:hypothetical protein
MEVLVEFKVEVPAGTPDAEVEQHQRAESAAAAKLAEDGHLVRLWRRPLAGDGTTAIGCTAPTARPRSTVARRRAPRRRAACHGHAARGAPQRSGRRPLDERAASRPFPDPGLPPRSHPGRTARPRRPRPGRRRIVPLTGGTFAGPELNGKLLPGSSADWQTVLPDGTALGDIRYTLETDEGDLLYVQSRSMRHGLCRTRRLQNRQLRTATNTKNQPSRSVR